MATRYALALLLSAGLGLAQVCTLTLPQNPLTATGLATPFFVSGCNQLDFSDQGSFVEAAILDTDTGAISIYHPLIVNQGSVEGKDFIAPVPVTLPTNSIVALFFGCNGNQLVLAGDTNGCVNGDDGSIFGQFAYCNSPALFAAANTLIAAGKITVPAPGVATKATGQACPAGTRDFRVVDMDQSDNVDSTYLLINGTVLAQNTAANAAKYGNATTELMNASDNALINSFIQPTMGCETFMAPTLTAPSGMTGAMFLNELVSIVHPADPVALVPINDDMTVINLNASLTKTNLYRAGVGQPQAANVSDADKTVYCKNYAASGIFVQLNAALFTGATTPAAGVANSLYTFLANRFATSFGPLPALACEEIFGLNTSPVVQAVDGNGVVTSASINTVVLQSILNGQITAVSTLVTTSATTTSSSTTSTKTSTTVTSTSTSKTSSSTTKITTSSTSKTTSTSTLSTSKTTSTSTSSTTTSKASSFLTSTTLATSTKTTSSSTTKATTSTTALTSSTTKATISTSSTSLVKSISSSVSTISISSTKTSTSTSSKTTLTTSKTTSLATTTSKTTSLATTTASTTSTANIAFTSIVNLDSTVTSTALLTSATTSTAITLAVTSPSTCILQTRTVYVTVTVD